MDTVRICPQCRKPLAAEAPQGLCPECLLKAGLPTGATTVLGDASAAPPAPTPAELASFFPQLEIVELIGAGGMGMVYKARQSQLDRWVALKILSPAIVARDPAFADRFLREARAMARLNHPNIVAVHDFGQAGPYFYFLMEYMDGANLRVLMARQELSPRQALGIVPAICDALQFAHDEGVMHRDIKPENILLDRRGRVKIADFGLAKLIGPADPASTALTQSGVVMGTPRYMAPEQIEKPQAVDHRADIYSLGVVFYEMLTGELPLGRFEPPSHTAGVDARLDDVVLRSLEKKPERRYQRASEVKTDVENIAGGLGQPPGAGPAPAASTGSGARVPGPMASSAGRERVAGPAFALGILGALNTLLALVAVVAILGSLAARWRLPIGSVEMVPLTMGLLFGPVIVFAARRMHQLRTRELAVFGSVLAMVPLTSPLFLVGIPVGVWCLVTLNKPEVKAAFRQAGSAAGREPGPSAPAPSPALVPAGPPRFSRKAILGAAWAMLALLALPTTHVKIATQALAPGPLVAAVPPDIAGVLMVVLLVVAMMAPFGTTILGLLAIHDIRHSQGRITGLPLALADALLFPLLALDALLAWISHGMVVAVLNLIVNPHLNPLVPLLQAASYLLPAILCLLVDAVLVFLAWRAVTRPVAIRH